MAMIPRANKERFFIFNELGLPIKRKRITPALEAQFPAKWRDFYMESRGNTVALTAAVRDEEGCSLADAWTKVRRMFNGDRS